MPELLTQPKTPESPSQVAGIKSEWWPASNRNGGRHQIGIPGRLPSESTKWVDVCRDPEQFEMANPNLQS